jgi:DNA transformation protein
MRAEDIEDLFAPAVRVSVRRMFGGHGIHADGVMIALQTGGTLYLKTDGETEPAFRDAGSEPFVYGSARGRVATSYWRMPEEAFDDPDVLVRWVGLAREAAARKQAAKAKAGAKAKSKRAS